LRWVLKVAPFALHFVYGHTGPEMQLRAAQRQFWLLFNHPDALPEKPAFAFFARPVDESPPPPSSSSATTDAHASDGSWNGAHDEKSGKRACAILSIRGTADIYDVVTDIRTTPVPFPPPLDDKSSETEEHSRIGSTWGHSSKNSSGNKSSTTTSSSSPQNSGGGGGGGQEEKDSTFPVDWEGDACFKDVPSTSAVEGMANAASWLWSEVGDVLTSLHGQGYELVLTGHSLGGAVAALLGVLVQRALPSARLRVSILRHHTLHFLLSISGSTYIFSFFLPNTGSFSSCAYLHSI